MAAEVCSRAERHRAIPGLRRGRLWRDLKRHFPAHQTFSDPDHLDHAIHKAIADMNRERKTRV
jgi:hypothetical protein